MRFSRPGLLPEPHPGPNGTPAKSIPLNLTNNRPPYHAFFRPCPCRSYLVSLVTTP